MKSVKPYAIMNCVDEVKTTGIKEKAQLLMALAKKTFNLFYFQVDLLNDDGSVTTPTHSVTLKTPTNVERRYQLKRIEEQYFCEELPPSLTP